MCTEVHSSSYLMFCSADRFWHCSQGCGDKYVCLQSCLCMDVCSCVRVCESVLVCVRLLIPLRNQTASTFVVLTGPEGLAL